MDRSRWHKRFLPQEALHSLGVVRLCQTDFQRRASVWGGNASELAKQIRRRLQSLNLDRAADQASPRPELDALHRYPLTPDAKVLLLATDIADGRCFAEAARGLLTGSPFWLAFDQVRIERVAGFQVRDRWSTW